MYVCLLAPGVLLACGRALAVLVPPMQDTSAEHQVQSPQGGKARKRRSMLAPHAGTAITLYTRLPSPWPAEPAHSHLGCM